MSDQELIMCRLKFIACVQKGCKLNTRSMEIEPDCYLTSVKRTVWVPDNRLKAFEFIRSTLKEGIDLIQSDRKDILRDALTRDIQQALVGVLNLKAVYKSDHSFIAKIDTVIEYTKNALNDLSSMSSSS